MSAGDVQYLVTYVVGLIGEILTAIGTVLTDGAANADAMWYLTLGIFGENGGLIYWINEKIIWLLVNLLGAEVPLLTGGTMSVGIALRSFQMATLGF